MLAVDTSFDDLESDLPFGEETSAPATAEITLYVETCSKCGGTGKYHYHSQYGVECFACKGTGKLEFKTSAEQRAKSRLAAQKRKASKAEKEQAERQAAFDKFEAANPAIAAWWKGSNFEFAVSLREACFKYGKLTEGQHSAAMRCVEKLNAMKAEREAAAKAAPELSIGSIEDAFATAKENGIKSPKLRLDDFLFKPAKAESSNAGAVYVMADGEYMGKIMNGKFMRSRDCSKDREERIVNAAKDPKGAAQAYGQRTGRCSICGRELTAKESIDRAVGQICAEKYGW